MRPHGSKLDPVLSKPDLKWPPRTELPYPDGMINHKLVGDVPDLILYTAYLENGASLERKCTEDTSYHNTIMTVS